MINDNIHVVREYVFSVSVVDYVRADVVIRVLCIVVGLRPCRPPLTYLQELFKSARMLTRHKLKSFNVSVTDGIVSVGLRFMAHA